MKRIMIGAGIVAGVALSVMAGVSAQQSSAGDLPITFARAELQDLTNFELRRADAYCDDVLKIEGQERYESLWCPDIKTERGERLAQASVKRNEWIATKKAARSQKQFQNGFDYASGVLLRGEMSAEELVNAIIPEDHSAFDIGVIAAIDVATRKITQTKPNS